MSEDVALKVAVSAYLAGRGIKLVHAWPSGAKWSAMIEYPYDPAAKKPLVTTAHQTGVGHDRVSAVTHALDRMGFGGTAFRVFVLDYMTGYLVKEVLR